MQVWGTSYSKSGDYVVFYDQAWWVPIVEAIGVPLIHSGVTYPIGNRILGLTERGMTERHREPLPDALYDAWWRDQEGSP